MNHIKSSFYTKKNSKPVSESVEVSKSICIYSNSHSGILAVVVVEVE